MKDGFLRIFENWLHENFYTLNAYSSILNNEYLASLFVEAVGIIKTKAMPAREVTMQLLKEFEYRQYSNPDFVIELYELLTVAKQRNYLIAGINGK